VIFRNMDMSSLLLVNAGPRWDRTRVARRAGIDAAEGGTGRKNQGSRAEYRRVIALDTIKLVRRAGGLPLGRPVLPMASPKPSWVSAARNTKPSTFARSAPSATRMPISLVRRATAYAVTPYSPTQARMSASAPNSSVSRAISRS